MMVWSINILVLAIGFLIVGMIKPKWILFWMDKPGRFPIIILSSVLFMVAAVMFGEANKANQQENVKQAEVLTEDKAAAVPVPTVVETIDTTTAPETVEVAPIPAPETTPITAPTPETAPAPETEKAK